MSREETHEFKPATQYTMFDLSIVGKASIIGRLYQSGHHSPGHKS